MVQSMSASSLRSERVAEIGPGALEARLDRIPALLAGPLEQLESVERLVVPGLGGRDDPGALLLGRGYRVLGALRQRGEPCLNLGELSLCLRNVGIPGGHVTSTASLF